MPVSALYDRTRSELQRSTTNNANSTSSSTPLPLSHDHSSNCHPKPLLHSTNTTLPQYTPVLSFPFLSPPFPHTKPFLPSLTFLLSSRQQREIATTVGSPRTREFAVRTRFFSCTILDLLSPLKRRVFHPTQAPTFSVILSEDDQYEKC